MLRSTTAVRCQGKVSLFNYAGASDWFCGKINSPSEGRKTLYTARFWRFWLGKHGSKAELTLESIREGIAKNYGIVLQSTRFTRERSQIEDCILHVRIPFLIRLYASL